MSKTMSNERLKKGAKMKPFSLEWYIDKIVRCTAQELVYHDLGDGYEAWRHETLRLWLEDRAVAKFEPKQ